MTVVPRKKWGARKPTRVVRMGLPVKDIFIHHTVTRGAKTTEANARIVRQVQAYHMDRRGWSDIGYSFLIAPNGDVFVGRGRGRSGGHTLNHNSTSYGISFLGNFERDKPTDAALEACADLIADLIRQGDVVRKPTIAGHRDAASTACPGRNLYAALEDIAAGVRDRLARRGGGKAQQPKGPTAGELAERIERAIAVLKGEA